MAEWARRRGPAAFPVRVCAAACAGVAVLSLASPAVAQHQAFVEALSDFTVALEGTFGDEGRDAHGALDRMERGLAEWDATLREYESNVAAIRPTASPARILDMHRAMGTVYLARGRVADAVREFEAAAALAPDVAFFEVSGGLAYEAAGRPADALGAYSRAFEIDNEHPVAAYMFAEALIRSSGAIPAAALATLERLIDRIVTGQFVTTPTPFIEAALLADTATETARFAPAVYTGAYALLERAEYASAVAAMRAAATRDPLLATPAPPLLLQGSDALRAGRVSEAIERFEAAIREEPGSEAHRMLGMAFWLAADHDRSIEHLEQAIALDTDDERARLTLVRVLAEIGETVRLERLLVETVEVIPASALGHWRLGRIYSAANRTADAAREYEVAADIGALTGEAPLLRQIADLHRREFQLERSEAALAKAVALRPNDATAHWERARALLQLERPDAALVELAAALLVDPSGYESCLLAGEIYLDAQRYADVVRVMTYAVGIAPERAPAYYALATALTHLGRQDEAVTHLDTFAQLQARAFEEQRRRIDRSTLQLEARILEDRGDFDAAVERWMQLLESEPDVAASHAGLAAALEGQGRSELAAAHYERALALGANVIVYRELATLYERLGRPEAAAQTRARLAEAQQEALGVDGESR